MANKYYQNTEKSLKKKHLEDIKIFLKNKKIKDKTGLRHISKSSDRRKRKKVSVSSA